MTRACARGRPGGAGLLGRGVVVCGMSVLFRGVAESLPCEINDSSPGCVTRGRCLVGGVADSTVAALRTRTVRVRPGH